MSRGKAIDPYTVNYEDMYIRNCIVDLQRDGITYAYKNYKKVLQVIEKMFDITHTRVNGVSTIIKKTL